MFRQKSQTVPAAPHWTAGSLHHYSTNTTGPRLLLSRPINSTQNGKPQFASSRSRSISDGPAISLVGN
jgi:hypothetical protein